MSKLEPLLLPLPSGKGGNDAELTVLSYGGGVDSSTILFKFIFDTDFKQKYAPNNLIVLFADTGNEHPYTHSYIDDVIIPLCKIHNIEFHKITADMGYHSPSWLSLTKQWEKGNPTIGSVGFGSSACSHNLKLEPQYRFMERLLSDRYGLPYGRKKGFKTFALYHGQISWLIGIAKGEESRVMDVDKETRAWKRQSLKMIYPLIDIQYNRTTCLKYIKKCKQPEVYPSNCLFCHFQSDVEILWLEKSYPEHFYEWAAHEQRKLDANTHITRNIGVCGKLHKEGDKKGTAVTLLDSLLIAKEKYPNASLEFLQRIKWERGHCSKSKY